MHSPLSAALLALILPMRALGQAPSTTADPEILQLVTPTVHASQFPVIALETLTTDALSFYSSYTEADTFNFFSAQEVAIASAAKTPGLVMSLNADALVLDTVYFHGSTSLMDEPSAYLSRLSAAATPWPFSSAMVSQASGLLLGYKSLVSRDLLNVTASQAKVTPGMSINVAGAAATTKMTATGNGQATGNAQPSGNAQPASPSKAVGVPAVTGNPQLIFGAAAAVAGMLGVIML